MGIPVTPLRHQDETAHRQVMAERINQIRDFTFDDSRVRTLAEITAGVTPVNYAYAPGDIRRYGTNTIPGTTDMTSALVACYAACKATGGRIAMRLWAEIYRFVTRLDWDGSVDVLGINSEFTILRKDGGIDGIVISGVAQQSEFSNFTLDAINDAVTGFGRHGITVADAAHLTMNRVSILNQGGHGLYLVNASPTGYNSHYNNLSLVGNGGDGLRNDGHYEAFFMNIDSRGNTGWGFNNILGDYHYGRSIVCQQNVAGGAQISGLTNEFGIYTESNTGPDISLTSSAIRCLIINRHVTTYPGDLLDAGTDNMWISLSGLAGFFTPSITRPKRTTNAAGFPVTIMGGSAGTGGTGRKGGKVSIQSGDADGSTLVDGEDVDIIPGEGATGGAKGRIQLAPAGGVVLYGAKEIALREPQVSAEAAGRTLALTDSDKTLYFTGGAAQTFTIPANGSVAFPIGTEITIINNGTSCSIAITTDTLVLVGTGATGTRTLSAAPGRAHLKKAASTVWFVDGTGIT